jgi:hypothetical protein
MRHVTPMKPLIRSCSYDAEKQVLTVCFQTSTYTYAGVPAKVGTPMEDAAYLTSRQYLFDTTVEGKYKSTRVTA